MQVLVGYISTPLSATEIELVTNVRSKFKGIHPNARQWEEDLQECLPKLVPASWLWGLINVVPKAGAEDRSRKYCIGNLAMDMFTELLHRRQRIYPNLFGMSVFLKHHTSVTLHNEGRISSIIWDSFKATPQSDVRYVFMPLLETSDRNWLLLVADLHEHSFLVYNLLPSPAAKSRRELVDSAGQVPAELSARSGSSFPATSMRFVSNFSNLMTYPKSGM
ncbi:hypothetical protein Cgig2_011716 [Carnegiea gigantea]|uniref:Ubiquitin-like protease family profile domain-containing protein n=1 Tax=Carnegiea gigantea TaxID=171969 RepID=A0A9Q1GKZ8_9CARY|nr:hypothetical protein Cgig2_011716 [Carnegiea gigantea]